MLAAHGVSGEINELSLGTGRRCVRKQRLPARARVRRVGVWGPWARAHALGHCDIVQRRYLDPSFLTQCLLPS